MNELRIRKASAGSGKTFQLALNYVTLLLGEDGKLFYPVSHNVHREILAVTFTNKATEEMKQRIISELAALTKPLGKSDFREALMTTFHTDADTLSKAAAQVLSDLLFDYANFNISTIDSFFQKVLRSFAYEVDLAGNYDLLLNGEEILLLAIEETLKTAASSRAAKRPEIAYLRKWLIKYMRDLRADNKSFDIYNPNNKDRIDLFKFMDNLTGEDYKTNRTSIDKFTYNIAGIDKLKTELANRLTNIIKEIDSKCLAFSAHKEYNRLVPFSNLVKKIAAESIATYLTNSGMLNSYSKLLNDNTPFFDKLNPEHHAEAQEILDLLRSFFTIVTMQRHIHTFGLFSYINLTCDELKRQNNTILLSDTNSILNQVIGNSDTPFIYERVGTRIKHFLIDEFQDTSRLQWSNFKPLIGESLSEGNQNLIIGDVKQSIYRFRNSDASMLDYELEHDPLLMPFIDAQSPATNYRSATQIIDFNNKLFAAMDSLLPQSDAYQTVRQTPRSNAPDGYVKVRFTKITNKDQSNPVRLNEMLQEIIRQLDPNQGNYKPGDITILAKNRYEISEIVNFLLANTAEGMPLEGVKVLSDEALFINSANSVRHIVEYLRKLITPEATEKQLQSNYYMETEMTWLNNRLRELKNEGMDETQALQQAIDDLHSQRAELALPAKCEGMEGKSLYELVEMLIENLPDPLWREDEALYLCAFQDFVLEFCQQINPTIHDFITLWDQVKDKKAIGLDSNVNAIRVMTIHKSKGLEFPCVHIPLMQKSLIKEETNRWFKSTDVFKLLDLPCATPDYFPIKTGTKAKLYLTHFRSQNENLKLEARFDEINNLYVAFTRAERELFIYLNGNDSQNDVDNTTKVIREALGLEPTEDWTYEVGRSTTKIEAKPKPALPKVNLSEYHVSSRKDYWTDTEIDTEAENF